MPTQNLLLEGHFSSNIFLAQSSSNRASGSMMMPITMQYLKKATANNHFFGQEGALWAFHFETISNS